MFAFCPNDYFCRNFHETEKSWSPLDVAKYVIAHKCSRPQLVSWKTNESIAVSKNCSSWPYQRLWICKDLSLERNLSWRKWRCWGKESFSLTTFLRVPCHGFLDKIRKVLCFLAECLSPWIAMGRRDNPVQYSETPDYNGCNWCGKRWWQ